MRRPRNPSDFVIARARYYEEIYPGIEDIPFDTKYSVNVVQRFMAEKYNWDYVELDHPYFVQPFDE